MCGIIGYVGAQDAVPILVSGLRKLEYRGYDSAGIAVPATKPGQGFELVRCEGKLARLEAALTERPLAGGCGIGHTRWATHGPPSEINAHPHTAGGVCVVHNGIIENYRSLREQLESEGRRFSSQTDTEVIAHLIDAEYARDQKLHLAVRRALQRLQGAWAIAVLHRDHPNSLIVARHASPLLVGLPSDPASPGAFVASDVAAILNYTRAVIDLDDGDSAEIRAEGITEHFDAAGAPVRRPTRQIDWSPVAAEKQGFKHFMLKEIFEQPRCVRDTLMGRVCPEASEVQLEGLDFELRPDTRVTLLGCGTSWHAALIGKYMIEHLARLPTNVELASEFRYRDPVIGASDVVVAISQSGETADTLAALREAKRLGAKGIAICNVVDSSIARHADHVLYTHAGPEISVASTKAFTSQLTMLSLLALRLGRQTERVDKTRSASLIEGLRSLPVAIDTILGQQAAIKTVARRYHSARGFLFLGRGLAYPVALEGALKLKEISYVHAEGYAAGEMKHGPIALIDETLPVVVLALRGTGYEKVLANLEEVRSRGGRVIAIATTGDDMIGDLVEDVILVPDVDPLLQPIVASIPLQLLAYFVADLKGTDVDQPRNLAKSVTVE